MAFCSSVPCQPTITSTEHRFGLAMAAASSQSHVGLFCSPAVVDGLSIVFKACSHHCLFHRVMVPTLEDVRALPKIELHAHLSGSITQEKLIELLERQGNGETFTRFDCRRDVANSVKNCFEYFDKIGKVVNSLDALKESTLHVLDAFAGDNCRYLELRTSPKQFKICDGDPSTTVYTSKQQYLETVRQAIKEFGTYAQSRFGFLMDVRVLLSVNRGIITSEGDALAQIDDIVEMSKDSKDIVVGIDICGNPSKDTVVPYLLPALQERRDTLAQLGLPITYHAAETPQQVAESEVVIKRLRELNIRRLGHVCFLPDSCRETLFAGGIHEDGGPIGIELCPTSNLCLMALTSLDGHHFPKWWNKSSNVMLSVNTDDIGLFSCDLSSELYDLAVTFDLSLEDLVDIQRQALKSSFHPDRAQLSESFERALRDAGCTEEAPAAKKLRT